MSFLDLKFNPFGIFIIAVHKISFACSPIDKYRILDEDKRRVNKSFPKTGNEDLIAHKSWWLRLKNPVEMARLIKRHHLIGNWSFALFLLHLSILFHFTIKATVHTFYTRSDRNRMQYFNSIYYPHLAGSLPDFYLFNNLFFTLSLICLSLRLLSAYELIRGSILNAHEYNDVRITQVNLGALTMCSITISDWIKIFSHSFKHIRDVRTDPTIRSAHLKLAPKFRENLDKMDRKDLLLRTNIINFNECYDEINIGIGRQWYQSWHYSTPIYKISSMAFWLANVLSLLGYIFVILLSGLVIIVWLYLEMKSYYSLEQSINSIETIGSRFPQPLRFLRSIEIIMLILAAIPQQFDAVLIMVDQLILISRANKLMEIFEEDLNQLKMFRCSYFQTKLREDLFRERLLFKRDPSISPIRRFLLQNRNLSFKLEEFNEKVQVDVRLASLLHWEFLNIKQAHSTRMNMIIIGNGILLTYIVSLFLVVDGTAQMLILVVTFIAGFTNIMIALIFCAATERTFKNLYRLMSRFLVNEFRALSLRTITMLRLSSEAFERKKDRSFLIAGLYAVTPDSVAPVSRQITLASIE